MRRQPDDGPASPLSPQAEELLATAPPRGVPGPVNRLTSPLFRKVAARRSRHSVVTAMKDFTGHTRSLRVGSVPVTAFDPEGTTEGDDGDFIVYVHGGAFLIGDEVDAIAPRLAQLTSMPTFSVGYGLAPGTVYPGAREQVLSVWAELTARRTGRGVLVGTSAGGNLALSAIQTAQDGSRAVSPLAAVLISPWADLTPPDERRLVNEGRDPLIKWNGMLDKAARAYLAGHDCSDPEVSPVGASFRGLAVPVMITTGTADLFAPDCHALCSVLEAFDVPVELDDVSGLWHAYQGFAWIPEAREGLTRIAHFIANSLR